MMFSGNVARNSGSEGVLRFRGCQQEQAGVGDQGQSYCCISRRKAINAILGRGPHNNRLFLSHSCTIQALNMESPPRGEAVFTSSPPSRSQILREAIVGSASSN